jgi:O-antigen/teichoic acid export membrane protein
MRIPRHILVTVSGWGSRVVSSVVQIALIRIVVRTLGADQYAAFAVLCALTTWFLLADLGLGFSLQNELSERIALGRDYGSLIRKVVGATFGLLVLEFVGLVAISYWTGGRLLREFPFLSSQAKCILFLTASSLLLIAGLGQVAYKIWYGEQKGYLSNVLPALGQLIGLGAVSAIIHFNRNLESLVLAYLLPSAIVGLFCLAKLWLRTATDEAADHEWWPPLLRKAAGFGVFGLAGAFVLQVDLLIVSQFLPPREIATYAIISRIFSFAFLVYSSALLALWPVCSEHLAVNDWTPVRRYVRYYIAIGGLFVAIFTLVVAAKMTSITSVIAPGTTLEVSSGVILLFGVLYLLRVWTDTFAMVLQSKSLLLPLWISTPVQALLSVILQLVLIPRLGLIGAVLGVIGSFLLTASWILPCFLFRSIGRLREGLPQKVMENEIIGLHSDL